MAQRHPSTPAQRAAWVSRMIAHRGEYGLVTLLHQEAGAARQTLYRWEAQGRRALEAAFEPGTADAICPPALERQVLTLLVETHPSARGIQAALDAVTGQAVSLGTISAILQEAGRRALGWMAQTAPPGARPLALDEIYGNNRRGAYLSVVDAASSAVWAAVGPLAVDTETWTLVLWEAQERGVRWEATSSDGGAAIQAALRVVDPDGQHGRDVWHVLHVCAQVQGRLDRRVAHLTAQTATVARQAARVAAGRPPRGRRPRTDVAAHATTVAQAQVVADGVRYLSGVLHELVEVVVVTPRGLLDRAGREQELDALLALLADLAAGAPAGQQAEVHRLHQHLSAARVGLLAFVAPLDGVQRDAAVVLGADGVALVAWAWQRRAILGPDAEALVIQLPDTWRASARVLVTGWERALRASSAAETWHSLLRPHVAVHRSLSPGLLALLAVWHNHRVYRRGVRQGVSPLHLSGFPDAPTDWLVALGYPPADAAPAPAATSRDVADSLPQAA